MKQRIGEAGSSGDQYVFKSDRGVALYDAHGRRYDPERIVHYGHFPGGLPGLLNFSGFTRARILSHQRLTLNVGLLWPMDLFSAT